MNPPRFERIACIQCDLLVEIAELEAGERANCPRCGHLLCVHTRDGLTRSLAYALAAAVLLVMANFFPFLSLEANGLESVMTLPRAALELYRDGYGPMAALVFGVIVVVPGLMISILVALLVSLVKERSADWHVPAGRVLFWLTPWSMTEVFVIAVIVSLVKIGHMATVVLGISFWSYLVFTICFIASLSSLDRLEFWGAIERHRA